jgi:hypothetical protein
MSDSNPLLVEGSQEGTLQSDLGSPRVDTVTLESCPPALSDRISSGSRPLTATTR